MMVRSDLDTRYHLRLLMAVLFLGASAMGCGTRVAPDATPSRTPGLPPAADSPASPESHRIVELVNLYRASLGLKPLEHHPALAAVAQVHAEAMAAGREPYSHAGLDDRVAAVGRRIRYQAVGENLAAVPASRLTPMERAVERWILSDAHRRAMEGCYELTGVGVARTPAGVTYISQLFLLRAPAHPSEARRGEDLEMARCR